MNTIFQFKQATKYLIFIILISSCGSLKSKSISNNDNYYIEKDSVIFFEILHANKELNNLKISAEFDSIIFKIENDLTVVPNIIAGSNEGIYVSNEFSKFIYYLSLNNITNNETIKKPDKLIIQSFTITNDSLIIAQCEGELVVFNKKGVIKKRIDLQSKNHDNDTFYYSNVYGLPISLHNDNVLLFRYNLQKGFRTPGFYDYSFGVLFDWKNERFRPLPLSYPLYFKKYNVGFGDEVQWSIYTNKLIYGFYCDPKVYIYNFDNGSTSSFLATSFHSNRKIPIVDRDSVNSISKLFKQLLNIDLYDAAIYDDQNKLYYRVVTIANGTQNNRKQYIQVFSNDLQLLGEFPLSDYGLGIGNKYILFNGQIYYPHHVNDSEIVFYSIKLFVSKS